MSYHLNWWGCICSRICVVKTCVEEKTWSMNKEILVAYSYSKGGLSSEGRGGSPLPHM